MSEKSRGERARERITDDAPVEILAQPTTGRTVRVRTLAVAGTVAPLWGFCGLTAQTPPPPTPRQAAVSADDIGVITDQWAVVVGEVLAPKIAADYVAGWRAQQARVSAIVEAANLTEEQLAQFTLPLIDVQEAAQQAAADAANRLLGIGDDLWGHARTSLTEGMAKGESVPKLAERVRQATGVSVPRATVIARTESMAARSAGAYDEMTTLAGLGIVESKTWLATHDARTRPTHVAADGQTVPFDAKFTVGGWPADRPHDPMLPAEEAANCRCTLLYGLAGEEPVYPFVSSLLDFHLPGQPDYKLATYGYEGDVDWFVFPFPETAGGRIAAVDKDTGSIRWINENADEYTQNRPVGERALTSALHVFHLSGKHDQASHAGGRGIRASLASAKSIDEINATIAGEAKRITGRDVHVDMAGSDPQIAREHGEAVLRCFERYPNARVGEIVTYGPGGAIAGHPEMGVSVAYMAAAAHWGETGDMRDTIALNTRYAGNPASYYQLADRSVASGFSPRNISGPMGTATHEFGHSLSVSPAVTENALAAVRSRAKASGITRSELVRDSIGTYATTNRHELSAEAFADVMINGSGASATSHDVFAVIDKQYQTFYGAK